jgi:cell wall-associated NlpC family hydrolase
MRMHPLPVPYPHRQTDMRMHPLPVPYPHEQTYMRLLILFLFLIIAACSPATLPMTHQGEGMPIVSRGPAESCPNRCPEPPLAPTLPPEKSTPLDSVAERAEPPVPPLPAEYELADLRTLPQDVGVYSSTLAKGVISPACRENLTTQFRKRYFSPWNSGAPLFDPSEMVRAMNKELVKEWYGENRLRVPLPSLSALWDNCDLGHLPSLNRSAITVVATNMRILPTARPFFKQPDSFPFDMLQQSGVKLNEPLRVLHTSRDGLWVFVETAYASGWIEARDVAYPDETTTRWQRNAEQVVIVQDFTPLRDITGTFVRMAKIGTILPLVQETDEFFEVYLAARSEPGGTVEQVRAKIPKGIAQRHPLELTGAAVARIGNQMIGTPYGWGELFDDRDCSALMRDFFIPFGIWLGRGSYDQTHAGTTITLAGKSVDEKAQILMKKGVPFLTLIWMKGHIMLYVGARDGKPLIFHDLWGFTVRDQDGKERKQIVGKAVVSTLTPGSELALVPGPLLARVSKIRILTDNCTSATSR